MEGIVATSGKSYWLWIILGVIALVIIAVMYNNKKRQATPPDDLNPEDLTVVDQILSLENAL